MSNEEKRKRTDYLVELALFLLLGILVGFASKTEAVKKITIGFDDYQLKTEGEFYKINDLQFELAKKPAEQQLPDESDGQ